MSNSRIKNGAYVIERPEEYYSDILLADLLLGDMRAEFQKAIRRQVSLDRAVRKNNFTFFSERYIGIPVEALKQSGKEEEARALFQQLCESWELRQPDEINQRQLPSHQELMSELGAYTQKERKQLWDLMSDDVRKRVGYEPSSDEDKCNSESEETTQFRLK